MTADFRALMAERHADFVARFNAGDADGIAETFYAADAVMIVPHRPPIEGRAAIRAYLRAFHAAARRRCAIDLTWVEADGALAFAVGRYTAAAVLPDGTASEETGNLLETWRRDADGAWRCIADMFAPDHESGAERLPGE